MTITMSDGTKVEVRITPKDIIDFERKFDVPVSKLQVEQRYEWLLYLAWLSAKRSNGVTETYDKWIENGGTDDDHGNVFTIDCSGNTHIYGNLVVFDTAIQSDKSLHWM